jgi:ABC-type nitrate/sulfonate/bicarbonate transport system ATPase subunit
LLKVAAGLMPATSGQVRLDGETVTAPSAGMGMLFQNALRLWEQLRTTGRFVTHDAVSDALGVGQPDRLS